MDVRDFVRVIGADFYAGVPDSQLKALCAYLMDRYGINPGHHVIAANEGNCVGIATGHYLATGHVPVVYMQNSGQGNAVNPIASLTSEDVYRVPIIYVIGWRGEPGVHDEPQHVQQGKITLDLLDVLGIPYLVLSADDDIEGFEKAFNQLRSALSEGRSVAVVVRKGALSFDGRPSYGNPFSMTREDAVAVVSEAAGNDPIVSTTGKISRELFEIRESRGEGHGRDFLTVGSMGHASSIALGIAAAKPDVRVWCLDGDGALLMHMGALAVIGACAPCNYIHVVLNNEAHETVGGMPTATGSVNVPAVALDCGYRQSWTVSTLEELRDVLEETKRVDGPVLIEVKCALGSRADLGRPTTTPQQNKEAFMSHLKGARGGTV